MRASRARPPRPLRPEDFTETHAEVAAQLGHVDTAFSEPIDPGRWSAWIVCSCGWESHAYIVSEAMQRPGDVVDREWSAHVIGTLKLMEPHGRKTPEPYPFSR